MGNNGRVTTIKTVSRPAPAPMRLVQYDALPAYPVRMEYCTGPAPQVATYVYDANPKRVEYDWQRPATLIYDGGLLD